MITLSDIKAKLGPYMLVSMTSANGERFVLRIRYMQYDVHGLVAKADLAKDMDLFYQEILSPMTTQLHQIAGLPHIHPRP